MHPELLPFAVFTLQGNNQLDGAFDYLKKVGGTTVDIKAMEEAAGVGVVVSVGREDMVP